MRAHVTAAAADGAGTPWHRLSARRLFTVACRAAVSSHRSILWIAPDPTEDFGVNLGALAAHGEVGVLIVSLDSLARITWNPFFPYMLGRIDEGIMPPPGH